MGRCRDCKQCTELPIWSLLMLPFRILWLVFCSWNVGLFIRYCPECHHEMAYHQRRADGSFKD